MGLFDIFKKKNQVDTLAIQKSAKAFTQAVDELLVNTATITANEASSEGFYFESLTEFVVYVKLFSQNKKIIWLSGDNYTKEYQRGYQLFEQQQYKAALNAFQSSLRLNPIGISARFEICEAYIRLRNMASAKKTLLDMKDYLVEEQSIAKFYRRLGFIETENGNFKESAACYLYSKKFENHPSIVQELMYITSQGGKNVLSQDAVAVMKKSGIPILTAVK